MSEQDFALVTELRERKHELTRKERKQEHLLQRIREQELLIVRLEVELEMEQQDVERLTRMSLANLFHTILRSKQEQLELERQEALAAALRLQEAKQSLIELKQELTLVGERMAELSNAHQQYRDLMKRKESLLRSLPHAALELENMEDRIRAQSLLLKEITEAVSAGRGVKASLNDASNSLQKAENWGNWDMFANGGLISTHIKHSHVDDARTFIHHANRQLRDFHRELADLQQSVNITVDISGTLKIADYWFDGLITDWIVQGRIKHAQEKTLEALHQVRTIVRSLEADHRRVERELAELQQERYMWIENAKH